MEWFWSIEQITWKTLCNLVVSPLSSWWGSKDFEGVPNSTLRLRRQSVALWSSQLMSGGKDIGSNPWFHIAVVMCWNWKCLGHSRESPRRLSNFSLPPIQNLNTYLKIQASDTKMWHCWLYVLGDITCISWAPKAIIVGMCLYVCLLSVQLFVIWIFCGVVVCSGERQAMVLATSGDDKKVKLWEAPKSQSL